MLGLGESDDEVLQTLRDLRRAGVRIVTLGQYLANQKRTGTSSPFGNSGRRLMPRL